MVTVRLKPRMTILPKRKCTTSAELHASWGNSFRDRVAHAHGGRQPLNTTRLNDSCLCAISHVVPRLTGSPTTMRSMRVKSIFFNRFNVICPVQPRAQKYSA
jgi:hypothetical protein